MLAPFAQLLTERRERGAALGAFTCYNATTALGVVRAAQARGAPFALLVSRASFTGPEGALLLASLTAIAAEASVPACVQVDHVDEPDVISAVLRAGAGAVMADGSRLPLDANVALTRRAVEEAAASGAQVEAELGRVEGGEDVAAATAAGKLSDPEESAWFAAETGIACLAVSIGNVHGHYAAPPRLDWERLERIRERTSVALSLHGASGLPDDQIRQAIALGICKVNVNTEIRERYLGRLAALVERAQPGHSVLELEHGLVDAVAEAVDDKLAVLAS